MEISIAEGQCMLFVSSKLSGQMSVPEVYGWCKDDGQMFIYVELIEGVRLEKSWEGLVEEDRLAVCGRLKCIVDAWRGLECDSEAAFIGKLMPGPAVRETASRLQLHLSVLH